MVSYYVSRAYDVRREAKKIERDEKDAVIYHSRDNRPRQFLGFFYKTLVHRYRSPMWRFYRGGNIFLAKVTPMQLARRW